MKTFSKTKTLNIRLTPEQRRRLNRAAALVSRERGEVVEPSRLLREEGMRAIDAIVQRIPDEQAA